MELLLQRRVGGVMWACSSAQAPREREELKVSWVWGPVCVLHCSFQTFRKTWPSSRSSQWAPPPCLEISNGGAKNSVNSALNTTWANHLIVYIPTSSEPITSLYRFGNWGLAWLSPCNVLWSMSYSDTSPDAGIGLVPSLGSVHLPVLWLSHRGIGGGISSSFPGLWTLCAVNLWTRTGGLEKGPPRKTLMGVFPMCIFFPWGSHIWWRLEVFWHSGHLRRERRRVTLTLERIPTYLPWPQQQLEAFHNNCVFGHFFCFSQYSSLSLFKISKLCWWLHKSSCLLYELFFFVSFKYDLMTINVSFILISVCYWYYDTSFLLLTFAWHTSGKKSSTYTLICVFSFIYSLALIFTYIYKFINT